MKAKTKKVVKKVATKMPMKKGSKKC